MAKLQWDQPGQRLFETGIDRGVFYKEDTFGVAWNGLTAVDEKFDDDTIEPVYFDGVKVNSNAKIGDFAATLSAITYPDEFLLYEGIADLGGGLHMDGQNTKRFGLSWRTMVGNDIDSTDHGYKLHILYNATAVVTQRSRATLGSRTEPTPFSWDLTTVPVPIEGFRPTAHVIFDSRFIPADILAAVEGILYGTTAVSDFIYDGGPAPDIPRIEIDGGDAFTDGDELPDGGIGSTDPRLPTIEELMDLVLQWGPRTIIPHTDTGIAELVSGPGGDLSETSIDGVFVRIPGSRLTAAGDGLYTLI